MNIITPSIEEWRKLFELAIRFKETKSWEWMDYTNIFGVQDPDTGKICYFNVADISGENGKFYALALYPGDGGLISLLDMLEERRKVDEQFYYSDIIVVQFSDREFLSKEDLNIIKTLGLKFRGRGEWISFKRMLPGCLPRIINKEEANLLISTLEQAIEICLMFRDKPELKDRDEVLIRTSKKIDSFVAWEDTWVELDYPEEQLNIYNPSEVVETVKNIIKPQKSLEEWIIDFIFFPNPAKDDDDSEEIYFPYLGLVISNATKSPINLEMYKYYREERLTYPVELFVNTIEMTNRLPRSVVVRDEDAYNVLLEITKALKVELRLVEEIELVEEFKNFLKEYTTE